MGKCDVRLWYWSNDKNSWVEPFVCVDYYSIVLDTRDTHNDLFALQGREGIKARVHAEGDEVMSIFDKWNKSGKKTKYVSQRPPDLFEIESINFAEDFKSDVLSVNVIAREQEDEEGYGLAQTLAAVSDKGYWYEAMLTYNWSSGWQEDERGERYYSLIRGFSIQFHIWDPNGKEYRIEESHLLGEERVRIRKGDRVNLSLRIQGGNVVLAVQGYKVQYPSYGAENFIGIPVDIREDGSKRLHNKGYFTGVATEYYHVVFQFGGKQQMPITFSMVEPREVKKGHFMVHTRNIETNDNQGTAGKENVIFEPNFSETIEGFVTFSGNPGIFTIRTRGDLFKQMLASKTRQLKQEG